MFFNPLNICDFYPAVRKAGNVPFCSLGPERCHYNPGTRVSLPSALQNSVTQGWIQA